MQAFTSPSTRLQELLPQLMQATPSAGAPYLKFQLFKETLMLLPMTDVREATIVSASQLAALPNMSESFMGLMSSRDQVFGVIDLPHALGLTSDVTQSRQYQIIIVSTSSRCSTQSREEILGLAVPQVLGMARLDPGDIEPCSGDIAPYLQTLSSGQVSKSQDVLLVMNLQASISRLGLTSPDD